MIQEKRKKYLTAYDQRAPIVGIQTQREICRRIASGEEIGKITDDPTMPSRHEIYDLIWREPEFGKMYKQAKMARCEVWAEEMRETSKKAADLQGVEEKKANAHVQAIRLQIETEKWLLSKWLPGQYADELPTGGEQKSVEGILEIIKMVTGMAKTPIQAHQVIDVPMIEDEK